VKPSHPARFLVVGGAGRTGRRVVDRLRASGHQAVVASRRAGRVGEAFDLSTASPELPIFDGHDGYVVSVEPPTDPVGAEALLHHGVAAAATAAARRDVPIVVVSQIYLTRPGALPGMEDITRSRARGERAVRESGARYGIIRPGWLHDDPTPGARVEQGDTGDGRTSREMVADACVHILLHRGPFGVTFELFDDTSPVEWPTALRALVPDADPRPAT
jgi:uncharacterized protein YbjT (DUF2867 family)